MDVAAVPCVLAAGAWLKNAACLLEGGAARWSEAHGDLSDPQACRALEASLRRLAEGRRIAAIAHDLHPDFFSTRIAVELATRWGVPAVGVQHHHAHIATVLAEHRVDAGVVGLALDGVGLGSDGLAWGGELLWVEGAQWQRLGHLQPLALPGGDVAAREPWRMAAAALHALGRDAEIEPRFAAGVGAAPARLAQRLLAQGLNCPPTSSAGRWFDAAAAALGLSMRQSHEAEAAIALERCASAWLAGHEIRTGHATIDAGRVEGLDLRPLLARLFDWPDVGSDGDGDAARGAAAAWFHLTLADALADWAAAAARRTASTTVCLGGGCFMNRLLTQRLTQRLQALGLGVLLPTRSGCGDAGLALGQAWVAAQGLLATSTAALIHETAPCA